MPISYVTGAIPAGNPTTSFTITIPTVEANDILILDCVNGGANADPTVTDNEPGSSWQKILHVSFAVASRTSSWWRRATADTSGKIITASGFTNSCAGVLTVYRGCVANGVPYEQALGEANLLGDETHAAITPTVDGAMICFVIGCNDNLSATSQACTNPGALTKRQEKLSTGGNDTACSHSSALQNTAASTGNFTWAQTDFTTGTIAFALKPYVQVFVNLAGVVNGAAGVVGAIKRIFRIIGNILGSASTTGDTKILRKLATITAGASAVTGITKIIRQISGIVNGLATVDVAVRVIRQFAGAISGIASTVGNLTVIRAEILLAGIASGVAAITGAIKLRLSIAGNIAGLSNIIGSIKLVKRIFGTINAITSVSGVAKVIRGLAGVITGIASVSGVVKIIKGLAGTVVGVATAVSTAKLIKKLTGVVNGVATIISELTIISGEILLAGITSGIATATGTMKLIKKLTGTISGVTTTIGNVTIIGIKLLAGIVTGKGEAWANLQRIKKIIKIIKWKRIKIISDKNKVMARTRKVIKPRKWNRI